MDRYQNIKPFSKLIGFDFVNDYISTKTVKEAEVIQDLINKLVARKKAYKPITLRKKVKVYDKR
jgi:hypothetical protein